MMVRKATAIILLLIAGLGFLFPRGSMAAEDKISVYNIRMFTTDTVLNAPINELYYWLELRPGINPTRALLDLWYSCSETILRENSSITVSLNGRPLSSRRLFKEGNGPTNWQVALPVELLKEGFNEIKISTSQRSTENTCQDVDNKANWVVILNSSVVHLEQSIRKARLSDYPYPFMNHLAGPPVQSVWYLKPEPEAEHIEAMLELAADWGKRLGGGSLERFRVSTGPPAEGGNQLLIGAGYPPETEPGKATEEKSTGYLALRPNGEGFYRLVIAGSGDEGLKKAVRALATDLIRQTEEDELFIRHVLPPEKQKQRREGERSLTLNDLGYSEIKLAGAFHQRTTITVRRPPGWAVGPGSYVQLYFRHSSLLNPSRSAVTIYVNGRPLKSLALNAGNAEKGELKAFIPRDELDKAEWNIEFAFYHDIGTADCSKKYEEVAWSVIEKETSVYLAPGKSYYVARWADFPYFDLGETGKSQRVALWLSEHPSASELTLAALLAARVGQVYGNGIEWKVYMGGKQFPKNEHCLFVIARNNKLASIAEGIEGLPIKPEAGGSFAISPDYHITPDYLEKNTICQVVGGKDGALYYIISSPDDEGIETLISIFSSPERMARLEGEVALVSREGRIINLNPEKEVSEPSALFRLPIKLPSVGNNSAAYVYIAVMLVVLLGMGATLWLVRTRTR